MQNCLVSSSKLQSSRMESISPSYRKTSRPVSSNPLLVNNHSSSMIPKSRLESHHSGKKALRPQSFPYNYLRYSTAKISNLSPQARYCAPPRLSTEVDERFVPYRIQSANPAQRYQLIKGKVTFGLSLTATKLNSRCISEPMEEQPFEPARVVAYRQQYCKRPVTSKLKKVYEHPKQLASLTEKFAPVQVHLKPRKQVRECKVVSTKEEELGKWNVESLGETINF